MKLRVIIRIVMKSRISVFGDRMKLLQLLFCACLAAFSFVGCSDDSVYNVPVKYGSYSWEYTSVYGYFNAAPGITRDSVFVDMVDDTLNVIRPVQLHEDRSFSFASDSAKFESPLWRLRFKCSLENGDTITFVEYVNISHDFIPHFNAAEALRKYRIETMVKKEKIPLALAMRLSERELLDFFSVSHSQSLDDLKSKTRELQDFVFFVCDYYLNPSHFVENFDRLAKDFDKAMSGKKKTAEFDSVIIVDNALFAGEDFYRELNFKNPYGFPKCQEKNKGEVVFNDVARSYYYSKGFKCNGYGYWALTDILRSSSSVERSSSSAKSSSSSMSSSSSRCVEDSVVVEGEDYYSCRNGAWKRMSWDEIVAYHGKAYEQKYGTCETDPWEKPLVYMEEIEGFMGCVQKKDEYVPDEIKVDCCHSIDSIQDGHFVGDAVYEISDYGFKWIFKLGALSESELTVRSIVVDGKKYKPTFSKQNDNFLIFITPQDTTISYNTLVDSLFDLSEKDREMVEVVENNYTRYYSSDHPLVTWDEAKSNCPPGFEIPDTLTFRYHYKNKESVSVWPEGRFMNFSRDYVFYFWTSQKVSEDTMLCARVMKDSDSHPQTIDFVECPMNASVVQAGYVTKVKTK